MGVLLRQLSGELPKDHQSHHARYTGVESEAQRGEGPGPQAHSPAVAELGLGPRLPSFQHLIRGLVLCHDLDGILLITPFPTCPPPPFHSLQTLPRWLSPPHSPAPATPPSFAPSPLDLLASGKPRRKQRNRSLLPSGVVVGYWRGKITG